MEVLSVAKGNILNDEHAIKVLARSKQLADDINSKLPSSIFWFRQCTRLTCSLVTAKQVAADKTQKELEAARSRYLKTASTGTMLFFCVMDLATIEPMYQVCVTLPHLWPRLFSPSYDLYNAVLS